MHWHDSLESARGDASTRNVPLLVFCFAPG